ncbi:hypothetical protein SAMN02910456_02703 [Ruminococcaceae bacterium YRB3002]|nr:hypothetical protein SAMN02910456_02703 [Ruminococcaceae bacterium YRB3002]
MKRSVIALILVSSIMMSACTVNINTNTDFTVETGKTEDTTEVSETTTGTTPSSTSFESDPTESYETEFANVVCEWRDDALKKVKDYEWYANEDGPSDSQVMFYTDKKVTDLKFIELRNVQADESGLSFTEMEVFTQPELVPDKGLLVNISFVGDLPEYAFSYVDTDGTVRKYMLSVSGNDGSIFVQEF